MIACGALSLAGGAAADQHKVPVASSGQGKAVVQTAPIDINSASRAELKKLPWIGDAEADRIIAGRPYLSKAKLVTHKILPAGVYQAIRHRIVAIQPAAAKRTAAAEKPAVRR